jgi:hypothetical protein
MFALAYNLANFLRRLVLPRPIRGWTLTALREKLIKIGAKVVAHAKYVTFQLAEVAVPRQLFAEILERIARLCLGVRSSAPTNRVRKPSPGGRGAPGGRIAGAERSRSVVCGGLRPGWGGSRRRFSGAIVAAVPSGGYAQLLKSRTRPQGAIIRETSGKSLA